MGKKLEQSNMPSQIPTSFAAAAGQGPNRDFRNGGKNEGRGSGDWVRKEVKPAINGTLTLRRPPTSLIGQSPGQEELQIQSESSGSQQLIYEHSQELRYSKQELLEIFKFQQQSRVTDESHVSRLFADGWAPNEPQGSSNRAGWGKNSDGKDCSAPEICWDFNGSTQPVGLVEMSEEEKRLFKADINSPFKPLSQNLKDSTVNGHKSSFSHGHGSNNLNHPSPISGRPNTRRQQANDPSNSGIASPNTASRFSRDDQSPFYTRKFDYKDNTDERSDDNKLGLGSSGLNRPNNFGSKLSPGQLSAWPSSSNTALSPMGAFGNFSHSNTSNSISGEKKPVNLKTESRFFQPISKDNLEDLTKPLEKSWRPRQRTDTDPFADDTLDGNIVTTVDDNTQLNRLIGDLGISKTGNTANYIIPENHVFQDDSTHEQDHQIPKSINAVDEQVEPPSPSDTNPYRSPSGLQVDRKQLDTDAYDSEAHLPDRVLGLGNTLENSQSSFGTIPRGFSNSVFDIVDRSQTSSAMRSRLANQAGALPSLGAIGSLGGWPVTSGSPVGITDHDSRSGFPSAFGNSFFGAMGETQSPGHNGLTSMFGPPSNSIPATVARGSKLGSLFPASMQAQMQTTEIESSGENETRQNIAFGTLARNSFIPSRDTDSPVRVNRHVCEDPFSLVENSRSTVNLPTPEISHVPLVSTFNNPLQNNSQPQISSESVLNQQLPTNQQRIMVMPDRMRWLYLDPQAQVQGPFSGLEMHDWYKASFFTPNLSVKKLEDAEFEPLGQLIRRIGNSREPFLVPQIGIPHGKPSTQLGSSFTPPAAGHGPGLAQSGAVQPPFANSFPSFGTTLTAEQQNNLERRKQEEQYLMARQREFLAQQQVNIKQMQLGGIPSVLHHHSSLQNIQSQPSFGGISSPISLPPQSHLANVPGFFDGLARQISTNSLPGEFYRDEDPSRLTIRERHGQKVGSAFGQPDMQVQTQNIDDIDFTARLHEFTNLRDQTEIDEAALINSSQPSTDSVPTTKKPQLEYEEQILLEQAEGSDRQPNEPSIMAQRTQQNVSTNQVNSTPIQKESPWAKVNTNIPMPLPPPQTISILPTPTFQKDHHNTTEILNFEKKPQSKTPEFPTAHSIAPWVKDPIQLPKPVSLKEMTEAEAKKAAKAEEIAAANRRANIEQEARSSTAQPAAAPPPGLPSTAIWGSSTSPHSAPVKSAWANSVTKAQPSSNKQKTLADIQKEEELRKQKLITATASQSSVGSHGSKRYADLASKTTPNSSPVGGPTWVTVGAGGKVRVPTGPATSVQASTARSSSVQNITLPNRTNSKPIAQSSRSNTVSETININTAHDELTRWAKTTLEKHLNPGINVNEFVAMLNTFPSEESIIADSIYSQSQTMNGRDFAHEFIRRRNNAERGVVEPVSNGSGSNFSTNFDKTGGWNEVAKKGPPKEEPAAGFKFVPNKKKGKK